MLAVSLERQLLHTSNSAGFARTAVLCYWEGIFLVMLQFPTPASSYTLSMVIGAVRLDLFRNGAIAVRPFRRMLQDVEGDICRSKVYELETSVSEVRNEERVVD